MGPFNGSFVDRRESCRPDDNSTSRSDNGTFFFLSGWLADGRHDGPSTIADPSIRLVFFFFFFHLPKTKKIYSRHMVCMSTQLCYISVAPTLGWPRVYNWHG